MHSRLMAGTGALALVCFFLCFSVSATRAQDTATAGGFKEIQIAASSFSTADPLPSWVDRIDIPPAESGEAIVVRLADTQVLVGGARAIFVRRAIAVNDAASLTAVGQIGISFVPEYHKVQLHSVQILRGQQALDRTNSATRFLQREKGLERGVYSGEVTASILVSDLRVGDTLVFAYTLIGQNPIFGDKFIDLERWDQGPRTSHRRLSLTHPVERRIAWRLFGNAQSKAVNPVESIENGIRKLVFEERSIPRIDTEPNTPPDHFPLRWLQFSEFSNWDDVAGWANALFQAREVVSEEFRNLVASLRNKPTPEERVAGALAFVQSEIRYFSVSLGESSHRPSQPDLVLERRYGDCKDKSLLLMSLLKELNIPSRAVLLQTEGRKSLSKSLPSPQLFDHAIVQVTLNGRAFYLDPTLLGQHGKLDRLGQVHEGSLALLVGTDTRGLSTIMSPNASELIVSEVSEVASLPKFGGEAQLRVTQIWRGVVAERWRLFHQQFAPEQVTKSVAEVMQTRYPGASIEGTPIFQDDRVNNVMTITTVYKVPNLAADRDGYWVVRFSPTNMKGSLTSSASATRAAPLYLPAFPLDARYSFEIRLPDEVRVISDPRAETVQNKHFTFAAASAFRGNVAKNTLHLRISADRVEPAQLAKYAEDVRTVGRVGAGIIAIPKAAIKAPTAAAAGKVDFTKVLRDRLQETISKTTEAIKSGKLAGADLASSYCLRSHAYSDLGSLKEAMADAQEGLKLAPNSPDSYFCRAYVHFGAGEFDKSVADYSKAISLGGTDPKIFHQRGIARFYASKLDEASEDFSRAAEEGDSESRVYSDLWLSWTYQRLGKPVPETVLTRAAAQPRGDWPRPALAVMTGHLAPEAMLKALESKTGDDRTMASSEGYFYLGQYFAARGDSAKAREFFEKAHRLNVIIYTEHTAAGFELQRLGAVTGSTEAPTAKAPVDPKKAARKTAPQGPAWQNELWKK
jgi:lipoprotein NlpI